MTHLTFEQISELVEHTVPDAPHAAHLTECSECRATYERVRSLVGAARALPHDVEPPAETWTAIRDGMRRERQGASPRRWMGARPWLAVAAVAAVAAVLVIAIVSLLASRLRAPSSAPAAPVATLPSPLTVPAVQAVDRSYAGTISDLRAALTTQRAELSPATVRTVERALTVIDSAIAEARAALAADPANDALIDILSAHYERKVDLLQRATELSSL